MKTEAMWIGSLQSCEEEPLGFRWKKCVKFLSIFITNDIKLLVENNFKQRLKKNFFDYYYIFKRANRYLQAYKSNHTDYII